ncbi:MAG TPA: agmatinase [bacterium]|nr:agmatinase [bacterium]
MAFLAARSHPHPALILLGVPYDGTSTFRAGSRHAPDAIRWSSQSIETYSPVLGASLDDVALTDLGNVDVPDGSPEAMAAAVARSLRSVPAGAVPFVLGGEHTVTLGAVEAAAAAGGDLVVLQLDAHTDLRDSYEGLATSHATVMRRVANAIGGDRIVQLGVRAGTAGEFAYASTALRHHSRGLDVPAPVWAWLSGRSVYVTLDIDVLDPADAPGTGNPEPEGVSARDLLAFVRRLSQLRVVGFDLVEVSPPYDPSGRTAILAATILREAMLAITLGQNTGIGPRASGLGTS